MSGIASQSPGAALLAQLARELDAADLREIAAADYGSDIDLHFKALQNIWATASVPTQMGWHPGEVLELMRWSEPEHPEWKPGASGSQGHYIRAFCCAALLLSLSQGDTDSCGEGDTVARLVASLIMLGPDFERLGLEFLDWRFPELERQLWVEAPYYAFLSLLLWLRLEETPDPAEVCRRVRGMEAIERAVRESEWPGFPATPSPFLTGLTHDMSMEYWLRFARELGELGAELSGQARVEVTTLAGRIGED